MADDTRHTLSLSDTEVDLLFSTIESIFRFGSVDRDEDFSTEDLETLREVSDLLNRYRA